MTNDVMDVAMSDLLLMNAHVDTESTDNFDYPLNFLPNRRSSTDPPVETRNPPRGQQVPVRAPAAADPFSPDPDPHHFDMERFFERRFETVQSKTRFRPVESIEWFPSSQQDSDDGSDQFTQETDTVQHDHSDIERRQLTADPADEVHIFFVHGQPALLNSLHYSTP